MASLQLVCSAGLGDATSGSEVLLSSIVALDPATDSTRANERLHTHFDGHRLTATQVRSNKETNAVAIIDKALNVTQESSESLIMAVIDLVSIDTMASFSPVNQYSCYKCQCHEAPSTCIRVSLTWAEGVPFAALSVRM